LARVASRRDEFEYSLTLASAADSIRRAVGARLREPHQAAVEEAVARARHQLDSGTADAAWHTGRRMSVRQAVNYGTGYVTFDLAPV
jgi:hypothetical protein